MGPAVVHDVRGLLGRQVRVDHRVVEPRALDTEHDFVGPVVVGQKDGDMVSWTKALGEEGVRQPARPLFESAKVTVRPDDVMTAGRSGWVAA